MFAVERTMQKNGIIWIPHMAYTNGCINEAKSILTRYFAINFVHKDNILEYNPLYNATDFVTDLLSQATHAVTNENQILPLLEYSAYPFIALQVHGEFAGPEMYDDAIEEAEDGNEDEEGQKDDVDYIMGLFDKTPPSPGAYSVRRDALNREIVCIDVEEEQIV